MSVEEKNGGLEGVLAWAAEKMRRAGYEVPSNVSIEADQDLSIMGYAKKEGRTHRLVVAGWALDSEMLGGLVLHELSHICYLENGAPSHDPQLLGEVLLELKEREGLNQRESSYLSEGFTHLQNVMVDDMVFAAMSPKEVMMASKFFAGWITDRPSGIPLADASAVVRNAFAIASMKRRGIREGEEEMEARNGALLSALGDRARSGYESIERLLQDVPAEPDEPLFRSELLSFFETLVTLSREQLDLADLR